MNNASNLYLYQREGGYLPRVAADGEHILRGIAHREHVARLAQHNALVLKADRYVGGAEIQPHAAG